MKFLKKYIFLILLILTILSPLLMVFAESNSSLMIEKEKNIDLFHWEDRFVALFDSLMALHDQALLDGEILITCQDRQLLHLKSESEILEDGTDSQFMIGSVSKQFFAVALLKALFDASQGDTEEVKIEDVKSKLHLPIAFFLPEESPLWGGKMPFWAQEISLHHLLSHTSGIPNYTEMDEFYRSLPNDPDRSWYESTHSTQDIVQLIVDEPLLFPPGSQFSYSNTGYVILAETIEAITGGPVSEYLQKTLFEPLGLSSTFNADQGKWNHLKIDPTFMRLKSSLTYDPRDHLHLYPFPNGEDVSVAKGSGSIISTTADLFKWNQCLHRDRLVLPEKLYELFITPNLDQYGYGIGIEKNEMGTLLSHNGRIGAYQTLLLYFPDQDISLVVLSNICSDFEKIESESFAIEESLINSIPDEVKRREVALEMIIEKYPHQRGFELIQEKIGHFFFNNP